jgi:hypothetical protein
MMLQVIVIITVVGLVICMVGLFAMMGELASRIPETSRPVEVEGAKLGASVPRGPSGEVLPVDQLVLIFSTSCSTCARLLRQFDEVHWGDLVPLVAVVGPDVETVENFAARFAAVNTWGFVADDSGRWSSSALGVNTSPTAALIRGGQLAWAFSFTETADLESLVARASTETADRKKVEHE